MSRKSKNRKQHTDETKELARARVAAGESLSKVARDMGIAKSTLHSWLTQADRDGYQEARESRKQKFINKAWESIENALIFGNQKIKVATIAQENFNDTIERFIELLEEAQQRKEISALEISNVVTALASLMKIPLKDVSTYIGTLYDKIALASGDVTTRGEVKGQVTQRYEYDITQRIVNDPEARALARNLFRRAVNPDLGRGRAE
jgi:transposase-like protein